MRSRFAILALFLIGLLVPGAALAQLPNFGSWSTAAQGSPSPLYYPSFSYDQSQSGTGIPAGNVGTLVNSNAPYQAELASQALVSAPFQQSLVDQPQPITLQKLTIASKTVSNFPFPSSANTFVSFTVTQPAMMMLTVGPIISGDLATGPFVVSGPAGFNWATFQGAPDHFSTYHLLPVGDYTFTGNVHGSQAGTTHSDSEGMIFYFVVPEPASSMILISSGIMFIASRPKRATPLASDPNAAGAASADLCLS